MKNKIQQLMDEINSLRVSTLDEAEALRIKYLSKKGEITSLFNDFRNVANEDKREVGQLLNELKNKAQDKLNELKESLSTSGVSEQKTDLTRTAEPVKLGTRHPLSLVKQEIAEIFSRIGFTIAEGAKLKMTGTYSGHLIFRPNIRHVTCRIHFLLRKILIFCSAHIHLRFRHT